MFFGCPCETKAAFIQKLFIMLLLVTLWSTFLITLSSKSPLGVYDSLGRSLTVCYSLMIRSCRLLCKSSTISSCGWSFSTTTYYSSISMDFCLDSRGFSSRSKNSSNVTWTDSSTCNVLLWNTLYDLLLKE